MSYSFARHGCQRRISSVCQSTFGGELTRSKGPDRPHADEHDYASVYSDKHTSLLEESGSSLWWRVICVRFIEPRVVVRRHTNHVRRLRESHRVSRLNGARRIHGERTTNRARGIEVLI